MASAPNHLILTVSLFLAAHAPLAASAAPPSEAWSGPEEELAARLLGVPAADLVEGRVGEESFPHLGLTVWRVKGVLRGGSEMLQIDVDANGRTVDLAGLRAAEAAAAATDPDLRLHPRLVSARDQAAIGEVLPVIAWLEMDTGSLDRFAADVLRPVDSRVDSEARRVAERALGDRARAFAAAATSPLVRDAERAGLVVRMVMESAPVVFLDVPVERLAELGARAGVRQLFLETNDMVDGNDEANATHRTGRVHNKGVKGSGTRVAVLEDNGLDITCPHLAPVNWFNWVNPDPDDHVHGTAGCIASQKADRIGAAEEVLLFSANATTYADSDVSAAANWISNQDIDITNMSFGETVPTAGMNFIDHLFNYYSRYYRDSYVASAGNAAGLVGTPAKAHNVLAVGAIDDRGNSDWSDDVMATFSSFQDPNTGCQKPNVSACGVNIETLSWGGSWEQTTNGTSFAAPHTTGNLANAMSVNAIPKTYPEAAMALMMATAWHNIEGANAYSAIDGAGAIHGQAAYECAKDGRVDGGFFEAGDFDAQDRTVYNVWLNGEERTRICFAWSAQVYGLYPIAFTTLLTLDYDIMILPGKNQTGGVGLASSSSSSNNYEIVEFTPPSTGWYSVRIDHNGTFAAPTEPWGIAWSQESDTAPVALHEVAFDTIHGHLGLPTLGKKILVDLGVKRLTQTPYFVVPSGTKGAGTPLPGGKKLPVQIDFWTAAWLLAPNSIWSGSVGLTDNHGFASWCMTVPKAPVLVGMDFHLAPIFLDLQESGYAVSEVGQALSLSFHAASPSSPFPASALPVELPFAFPFYGKSYTSCFVNPNGTVTFGAPDLTPKPSLAAANQGPPRIAPLWNAFTPGVGEVRVTEGQQGGVASVVIELLGLRETGAPDNGHGTSARVYLLADGTVRIQHGIGEIVKGLVGILPGTDLNGAPPRDLSVSGEAEAGQNEAMFELFGGGAETAFDLSAPLLKNDRAYWRELRFAPVGAGYRLMVFSNDPSTDG